MEAGIVGLPNVGKSTLFNALTESSGAEAKNYPFCTIEPNVGVVAVPDPRLQRIQEFIPTDKVIPTAMKIVDIAGLVKGASEGQGRGNQFLSHIREVDAIMHVVRCFNDDNITHVDGSVDPVRDIETIETELLLADLEVVESAHNRSQKKARSGDKEAVRRVDVLEQCRELLQAGTPLRALELSDEEDQKVLRGFGLMTAKKMLYVGNVDEDSLDGGNDYYKALQKYADETGGETVMVCARIEEELIELEPAERAEMLEGLGMAEPALHVVIRAAYKLLGLQSFFTAGQVEVRAWPILEGSLAPQAAGVIHTDFEKGFIRAEIFSLADLEEFGSEAEIRANGRLRVEGKEYVMQENDIVHFLCNP